MHCVPGSGPVDAAVPARVPFALYGRDHSVFLETFKRGDLDTDADGKRTIVLRLYEAYGGNASVVLRVNVPGAVATYLTNLLGDDEGTGLHALEAPMAEAAEMELQDGIMHILRTSGCACMSLHRLSRSFLILVMCQWGLLSDIATDMWPSASRAKYRIPAQQTPQQVLRAYGPERARVLDRRSAIATTLHFVGSLREYNTYHYLRHDLYTDQVLRNLPPSVV